MGYYYASGEVNSAEVEMTIDVDELMNEVDLDDSVDTWFCNNEDTVQEKIAGAVAADPLLFIKAIADGYESAVNEKTVAVSLAAEAQASAASAVEERTEARRIVEKIMDHPLTSLDSDLHDVVVGALKVWRLPLGDVEVKG